MNDITKILIGGLVVDSIIKSNKEDDMYNNISGDRDYSDSPVDYYTENEDYLPHALEFVLEKFVWSKGGKVGEEPLQPDDLEEEEIEEAMGVLMRLVGEARDKQRRIREREIIKQLMRLLPY